MAEAAPPGREADPEVWSGVSAAVDVAIAGAGPAGVAAALTLARHGFEVALVDRARFPRDKPCGEGLLPSAVAALERLGVYERVRASGCPLDGIGFSFALGEDAPSASAPFRDRAGAPALGLGIARRVLDAALVDAARRAPGVTVLDGVSVSGVIIDGDGDGDGGGERGRAAGLLTAVGPIRARAVVVADGLRSPLRRQLGLDAPPARRQRLGVRAHFLVPSLPFGRRVQVLLDGPVEYYLTPVGEHALQVAVLGSRRAFVERSLSAATLLAHLAEHPAMAAILDGARPLDRPLGAGPLERRARAVFAPGVLLAGDAAGYVDAITGEGVGLALESGIAAGEVLAAALPDADARALAPYARLHDTVVHDAERLTRFVLFCAERPWLARRMIEALARRPSLFARLLTVQAGAPLASVFF